MTHDATAPVIPDVSVQVDDVDACHAAAVQAGAEIACPLTLEPRDVRRFFARDPDGQVINALSHIQDRVAGRVLRSTCLYRWLETGSSQT